MMIVIFNRIQNEITKSWAVHQSSFINSTNKLLVLGYWLPYWEANYWPKSRKHEKPDPILLLMFNFAFLLSPAKYKQATLLPLPLLQDENHETSTSMCERFRDFCVFRSVKISLIKWSFHIKNIALFSWCGVAKKLFLWSSQLSFLFWTGGDQGRARTE